MVDSAVRTPGDRPPYLFLGCLLFLLAFALWPGPTPVPAAEVLREPSARGAAEWTRPSLEALLSGEACIPMSILLSNRPTPTEHHSYRVPVDCPKEGQP